MIRRKQVLPLCSMVMMVVAAFFLLRDRQPFVEKAATEPIRWITLPAESCQQTTSPQIAFQELEESFIDRGIEHTETSVITVTSHKQTSVQQMQIAELEQDKAENGISYPLDLNAASAEELETLPGIGSILAQRIISYREMVGEFSNLEELMLVNGIGTGIYEQISPYLFIIGGREPVFSESELPKEWESATESIIESIPILDINTATAVDFQKLPGVTPTIAENIVQLRIQIQYFQNIYELLYADGMTDALFLSIRDYLYVNTM
ncbi:MAG: helix-hairpin-helix domain-containing protein [Oscillospiraceae bacterium]|nr:helix-hairpin-helix domain-containing protein [Oscillospiraceae bacterium]